MDWLVAMFVMKVILCHTMISSQNIYGLYV